MDTLTQRQKTTCSYRNFPHWILKEKALHTAHALTHTNPHKISILKKLFDFLKELMFGRDTNCFTEKNKNVVFLLNFSLTALYFLSQSIAVRGLQASLFPLPPAVRLLVTQPSMGTQNNVTRHENCMNFPAKEAGGTNTLLSGYRHFCFQFAWIKQRHLEKDLRASAGI